MIEIERQVAQTGTGPLLAYETETPRRSLGNGPWRFVILEMIDERSQP